MSAGRRVKEEGADNDLLARIAADPLFSAVHGSLQDLMDPAVGRIHLLLPHCSPNLTFWQLFIGRSPQQVDEFLQEVIDPLLEQNQDKLGKVAVDGVNV